MKNCAHWPRHWDIPAWDERVARLLSKIGPVTRQCGSPAPRDEKMRSSRYSLAQRVLSAGA